MCDFDTPNKDIVDFSANSHEFECSTNPAFKMFIVPNMEEEDDVTELFEISCSYECKGTKTL